MRNPRIVRFSNWDEIVFAGPCHGGPGLAEIDFSWIHGGLSPWRNHFYL